ncbi:hypothetical protein BH23PLA1_BH23PLA1_23600 [soil metagenome]
MARPDPRSKSQVDPGRMILPADADIEGQLSFRRPETTSERSSRLKQSSELAAHDRRKEWVVLIAVTAIVSTATVLCIGIVLLHPYFPDDSSRWASVTLSSIISVAIGYLGGKASKASQ